MKATKKMIADAIRVLECSASYERSPGDTEGSVRMSVHVDVLYHLGHETYGNGNVSERLMSELVSDAFAYTPSHFSDTNSAKQGDRNVMRERRADYAEAALRMSEGWLPPGWERV